MQCINYWFATLEGVDLLEPGTRGQEIFLHMSPMKFSRGPHQKLVLHLFYEIVYNKCN